MTPDHFQKMQEVMAKITPQQRNEMMDFAMKNPQILQQSMQMMQNGGFTPGGPNFSANLQNRAYSPLSQNTGNASSQGGPNGNLSRDGSDQGFKSFGDSDFNSSISSGYGGQTMGNDSVAQNEINFLNSIEALKTGGNLSYKKQHFKEASKIYKTAILKIQDFKSGQIKIGLEKELIALEIKIRRNELRTQLKLENFNGSVAQARRVHQLQATVSSNFFLGLTLFKQGRDLEGALGYMKNAAELEESEEIKGWVRTISGALERKKSSLQRNFDQEEGTIDSESTIPSGSKEEIEKSESGKGDHMKTANSTEVNNQKHKLQKNSESSSFENVSEHFKSSQIRNSKNAKLCRSEIENEKNVIVGKKEEDSDFEIAEEETVPSRNLRIDEIEDEEVLMEKKVPNPIQKNVRFEPPKRDLENKDGWLCRVNKFLLGNKKFLLGLISGLVISWFVGLAKGKSN